MSLLRLLSWLPPYSLKPATLYGFALLGFAVAVFYMTAMDVAFACDPTRDAGCTYMGAVVCKATTLITGNLGRGLATVAVIMLGTGALVGRVSWHLAMLVAVGIGVIINAAFVVGLVFGDSAAYFASFDCV